MTPRRSPLALSLVAGFALAALGAGCAREHLSSNYGQAYSAWFVAQHAAAGPANPEQAQKIISSLDAQEAAAVSKSYRQITRADENPNGPGRLLMINPNRGGDAAYIPPPSVPGGGM